MEMQGVHSEPEGSYSGSAFDHMDGDPQFDVIEDTHSKFSNLSINNNKEKAPEATRMEIDPEELGMTVPNADVNDEKNIERVRNIIQAGDLQRLKVLDCILYLRRHGLELTGNKDTLVQRIREHIK